MEKDKAFKYNTEIIGTTKVHSVKSDYKIRVKNEVTYKGLQDDLYRFNIVETLYELDEYEDPIMTQIAEMTNKICSIYKEIEIGINAEGVIEKVYNRGEIRKKWQKVKEWLTNAHPLESYEIIRAKEYELSNEEMEIKNIRFIHFLHQYFFIFKQNAENGNTRYIKKNEMDRFGGGVVIPVNINLKEKDLEDGTIERTYEGKMVRDNKVIERLRTFVKDNYMHPEYKMTGKYIYNNITLLESDFTITEELGEFYYNHSFLRLTLEE
jgi:hypothetical protein